LSFFFILAALLCLGGSSLGLATAGFAASRDSERVERFVPAGDALLESNVHYTCWPEMGHAPDSGSVGILSAVIGSWRILRDFGSEDGVALSRKDLTKKERLVHPIRVTLTALFPLTRHPIRVTLTALFPLTWHPTRFTLIALFLLTWLAQRFADPWLRRIEDVGARLALRKGAVIFGAALVSIVARLLLLPLAPVPIPGVHDESSYLLAADTFAHGRLTNPPHQQWVFLDTFHVLQHPTYVSKYPPAQGMALALGQLLGSPWIGVLLSMAAMCAAVAWALQGWLPARWALLGTLIVLLRVDLMSYWVDSYWGGAVAATGGALVIGALPRILRRCSLRDSVLMGVGAALLANSRPVEGLLFCLPVAVVLAIRLFSRRSTYFRLKVARGLLPAILVLGGTVAFMGYYNWRVTGNALLFPNVLYRRLYWDVPVFVWQPAKPALTYANPQFTGCFEDRNHPAVLGRSWAQQTLTKCHEGWSFFLGRALTVPFLTLPWLIFDRRVRFLVLQFLWCGVWLLLVYWFEPHYAAPLTAAIFAIIAQAIRHLRQWKLGRYRVGIFASRLILVLIVARVFSPVAETLLPEWLIPQRGWNLSRAQIAGQLQATSQKNLVIVRYAPDHNVDHEWVYNAADIDGSKVVWARDTPGQDLKPLLDYYRDRQIWVVDADAAHPRIEPYHSDATAQSSR